MKPVHGLENRPDKMGVYIGLLSVVKTSQLFLVGVLRPMSLSDGVVIVSSPLSKKLEVMSLPYLNDKETALVKHILEMGIPRRPPIPGQEKRDAEYRNWSARMQFRQLFPPVVMSKPRICINLLDFAVLGDDTDGNR